MFPTYNGGMNDFVPRSVGTGNDASAALVFADQLTERGDARGTLIVLEAKLAATAKNDEGRAKMQRQARAMRAEALAAWAKELGVATDTLVLDGGLPRTFVVTLPFGGAPRLPDCPWLTTVRVKAEGHASRWAARSEAIAVIESHEDAFAQLIQLPLFGLASSRAWAPASSISRGTCGSRWRATATSSFITAGSSRTTMHFSRYDRHGHRKVKEPAGVDGRYPKLVVGVGGIVWVIGGRLLRAITPASVSPVEIPVPSGKSVDHLDEGLATMPDGSLVLSPRTPGTS